MDPGVRATVVTAGHCTHAELTSGHALASCYSCCVHSAVYVVVVVVARYLYGAMKTKVTMRPLCQLTS